MNRPRVHNKHLPRNVYLRHGAYWYVKRGKWLRLGATLKEALAKYANIYEGAPGSMPDLIAKAMPVLIREAKPNTAAQYRIAGKKLAKMFAAFQASDVIQADVMDMMDKLADTPNMANRCLSVLKMVFKYAVKRQIIERNPAQDVDRHKEKKRDRLLSEGEIQAIYAASGPRLQVIIALAILTGQRIGDVLKIHRSHLLDEGIRFEQQKTGAKLIVAWTDELRSVVARAKTLNQNIRALTLLHNRRGKPPDYRTVREQWDKACKAAKVEDAHLHDLRALSATWTKRQGGKPTSLLGHSSALQTERYLRDRDAVLVQGPSFGRSKDLLDSGK
jgi:integrase